jgi:hypothetical protein
MLTAQTRIQEHFAKGLTIRIDVWIFIFSVVIGATAILWLKSGAVLIPHADLLGIAVPVAVMAIYVIVVTVIPRMRLRLDQSGDNLYYLGFTYTLCSLAITLYRFHSTEGTADYIVSNFGIALTTTIVGVVSRICLHQMREDPLELEREARSEITDAVSRLRGEIDLAVREFNHFNRTLQQSAQEAIEAQGRIALESLDKSTKQYAEVTVRSLGYLENCFIEFQKQAGEFNTNSQHMATALATFSRRVDEVEAPKDLLSVKLAPTFARIAEAAEQTAGRVSSERQRNQNVAKLTSRLEEAAASIEGIFDRVADKEGRVTTAIQQAVNVASQTAELSRQINEWTERFTDIEGKQTEILGVLSRASEGAQDRDRARDESLRRTLADTLSAIGEYESRVQSLLQSHSESFETELERAKRAFKALSVTLSDGASLLASELGKGNELGQRA